MADTRLSFGVLSTLAAQRVVTANTAGSNNVIYPSAATVCPIGITVDTVKDTNQGIEVQVSGIAKLYFNDTIGATGSLVAADSAGRGVPHVNTTAGSYVIGILVGPAVAATGTVADVLINPFYKAIP